MSLDCFGDNFIGIRGECDVSGEPTSCLYINDLPGVSLRLAANLADEESVKGVTLLRRIEKQALVSVWSDLRHVLSEDFVINRILETRRVSRHQKQIDIDWLINSGPEVGVKVGSWDCDPFTAICINGITIRANTTQAGAVIKIVDGFEEVEFTADLVAGKIVRVPINYTAKTDELYILLDGDTLELEDTPINNGCSCSRSCECEANGCFWVQGWDGSEVSPYTYGMTLDISCICDDSRVLCNIKKLLGPLVQLKMGILLMYEIINSKRCNFMVANSKDEAEKMLIAWNGGLVADGMEFKGDYWRDLKNVANSVRSYLGSFCSKCIKCTTFKIIEQI